MLSLVVPALRKMRSNLWGEASMRGITYVALIAVIARPNGDRRHPCQIDYMRGCENYQN